MGEQFLNIEGRRLRVLTATHDLGSPWLVLWPGLGGTAEEFHRFLREGPGYGYNVAALDPPGHGRSDAWENWNDRTALTVWDAVLEELAPTSALILGGHSAGAYFAVNFALQNPLCGGLVLLEGGCLDPVPDGTDMQDLGRKNQEYLESQRFSSWEAFWHAERSAVRRWDNDAEVML